jgi:hypothetical protein
MPYAFTLAFQSELWLNVAQNVNVMRQSEAEPGGAAVCAAAPPAGN